MIAFTVHGVPAPQGSKNQFGAEANPRTRPWRAAVTAEAARVRAGKPLLTEPLHVEIEFRFPRPKSHYRTGKNKYLLRDNPPDWVTRQPDVDKLARAILDALTGVVWRDDAQVACLTCRKVYGEPAQAAIRVIDLTGTDALEPLTEAMAS